MHAEKVPFMSLYTTPEFKGSQWIKDLCEVCPELWVTHDQEIPGHFGTYFGYTNVRKDAYTNPYIRDLYTLHEQTRFRLLHHVPTMPRGTFHEWSGIMAKNEAEASLVSEVEVYFRIPNIRPKTFPHAIWADHWAQEMTTAHQFDSYQQNILMRSVRKKRLIALTMPTHGDFLEAQIHNYGDQNIEWCRLWSEPVGEGIHGDRPAFRVVEEHLNDPDRDENHLEWLNEVSCIEFGRGHIPFRRQALAFETIHKASYARFGNHILTR